MKEVTVVGGGFSGLATAYFLAKRAVKVRVVEKSDRLGGLLGTERKSWGLVESAANGFLATQLILDFCDDIGVDLVWANKDQRKRFIFRGRPRRLPLGGIELTRFLAGILTKRSPSQYLSAANWATQRFGYGGSQYLIEPAVQGIFGTRLENLSAKLLFDYFFKNRPKPASRGRRGLCGAKGGMGEVIDKCALKLKEYGVEIILDFKGEIDFSKPTVLAVPAPEASMILLNQDQSLAEQLKHVTYLPLTSVTIGFAKTSRKIVGFGCLFPKPEKFNSLGVLFNTCIFQERGPMMTETYILPVFEPDEKKALQLVLEDRQRLLPDNSFEQPEVMSCSPWKNALPEYSVELEKIIDSLHLPKNVYLVGNYLGKIGLSKIFENCKTVADRLVNDSGQ